MMRTTPVFLGLTRPPKFFGLPIGYFIGLIFISVIPFVLFNDMRFLLIAVLGWPILWVVADRNPHLFEIASGVYRATPPTKNKDEHGGDAYGPAIQPANPETPRLAGKPILKEDPAAAHLPYLSAVADDVILTRQGDLMASAIVGGLDSFTSEDVDVDRQAIDFARLAGSLGERFGFYVSKVTVPADLSIDPAEEDLFTAAVDRRWQREVAGRDLKRRVLIVTILMRPSIADRVGLTKLFRPKAERAEFQADMVERMDRLNEAMRLLERTSGEGQYQRLTVKSGEWLGLLGAVHGQAYQKRFAVPGQFVADAIVDSTFTFRGKVIEIDNGQRKRFAAIFSLHAYMPETVATMFDGLELPYDLTVTNSFTPLRNNMVVEKMKLVRRQMKATDDAARSDAEALEVSADNVASGRQSYGIHHFSVMVSAETEDALERAASEIWRAAQETGATVIRERSDYGFVKGVATAMFFAQAPGNWSHRTRSVMVSADNFADAAAFHAARSGRAKCEAPWGEIVTVLPTVAASAYRFNFHEAGRRGEEPPPGHALVLGRTGSGKTLGTAFLMAQARRVGARLITFDKDHGLEMALRAMGGSYTSIRVGEATGLNPFLTEVDERGAAWLTDWLTDILSRTRPLETAQTVALNQAVRQIVQAEPELRSFSGLESLVASTDDDGDLVARVREWTATGRYGWLFSKEAQANIEIGEDVLGIDMTEILDLDAERSAMLAYLFRRVERVIEDRRPTMIVIDEAWKMLDDPIFERRLHDWLVTMRKKNCVVVMLTQTPGHLERSKVGQIIAESVATQLLFPNARANPEDYRILRLNEREAGFLSEGTGGSRTALVRSGSDSVFVDMDLSGLGPLLTVLGGGSAGAERAPYAWRENPDFWKEMT